MTRKPLLFVIAATLCVVVFCADRAYGEITERKNHELQSADVEFGEAQLKQMMVDRPKMAGLFHQGSASWHWIARQFAGENTGSRYFWKSIPRENPRFLAFHHYPISDTAVGWVTVFDKDEDGYIADREKMWSALIYELFNMKNDGRYKEIAKQALAGGLTKEEFAKKHLEGEYDAFKEQCAFYQSFLQPDSIKHGTELHEGLWCRDLPPTYEQWFQTQAVNKVRRFYESFFDREIVPRIENKN